MAQTSISDVIVPAEFTAYQVETYAYRIGPINTETFGDFDSSLHVWDMRMHGS